MNGAGKKMTVVSGYHTGHHSQMLVRHVPFSCTVAVRDLAQETANAVGLESAAQGCVSVKVDV